MYLDLSETAQISDYENWLRNLGVKRFQVLAPSKVGRGTSRIWKGEPKKNQLPGYLGFSEHQWRVGRHSHNCYHDHLVLKPDGSASPCIMTRAVSYGNASTDGVSRLLQSEAYRHMTQLSKDRIPGCMECEFRYACFDCRPDAMKGTADYFKKPDCGYDPRLDLGIPLYETY
jgi:radical SAM protein with 4Fe4S-binding SPASM domain